MDKCYDGCLNNDYNNNEGSDRNKRKWKLIDFFVGGALGKGRFGLVYKAKEINSNQTIALKMMDKSIILKYQLTKLVRTEIEIQTRLNHPNIIKMYGYFYDINNIYTVSELANYGSLFDITHKINKPFSEKITANIIIQLVNALIYLKQNNIIHRDLKLENILVTNIITNKEGYEDYIIKISDFGCCTQYFKYKKIRELCGTVQYLSPEILLSQPYSFASDTWSIGIIAYELICGFNPFYGENDKIIMEKIKKFDDINIIFNPLKNFKVSKNFYIFLKKILEKDPIKRIEIEKILDLDWIKENKKYSITN